MAEAVDYKIFDILSEDFTSCLTALRSKDSQPARRALVRAAYAMVEGETYAIKQDALDWSRRMLVWSLERFDTAELSLLKEEDYVLTDKGTARTQKAKLRTLDNVQFAFSALAKAYGFQFILDKSGKGWQNFRRGLDLRDRLTHPKCVADLAVADDELSALKHGMRWYSDNVRTIWTRTEEIRDQVFAAVRVRRKELEDIELSRRSSSESNGDIS